MKAKQDPTAPQWRSDFNLYRLHMENGRTYIMRQVDVDNDHFDWVGTSDEDKADAIAALAKILERNSR